MTQITQQNNLSSNNTVNFHTLEKKTKQIENQCFYFYIDLTGYLREKLKPFAERSICENDSIDYNPFVSNSHIQGLTQTKLNQMLSDSKDLKTIFSTLKKKKRIYISKDEVVFKHEEKHFILILKDIEEYNKSHQLICDKSKLEKAQILNEVRNEISKILKSKNAFNVDDKMERIEKNLNLIGNKSYFAVKKAINDFEFDKTTDPADFFKKIDNHFQKDKNDAVKFVNLILEVLL